MVRSLASRAGGHHRMGRAHAAAKATEAAASEATEAATAAPPPHSGHADTRQICCKSILPV
jgi:hypothetical protein